VVRTVAQEKSPVHTRATHRRCFASRRLLQPLAGRLGETGWPDLPRMVQEPSTEAMM